MRSRYRQSINPWPFAIVNKKGISRTKCNLFELLFILILNLLLEFEPNYLISSTKSAPKKEHMHVQLPGKWKKRGHSTKRLPILGVVWLVMTMWNVWAHEYLAILVGCQLFTAYCLSAIIWSRFVNETHEYLINSFIDIGGLTIYAFAQRKFY